MYIFTITNSPQTINFFKEIRTFWPQHVKWLFMPIRFVTRYDFVILWFGSRVLSKKKHRNTKWIIILKRKLWNWSLRCSRSDDARKVGVESFENGWCVAVLESVRSKCKLFKFWVYWRTAVNSRKRNVHEDKVYRPVTSWRSHFIVPVKVLKCLQFDSIKCSVYTDLSPFGCAKSLCFLLICAADAEVDNGRIGFPTPIRAVIPDDCSKTFTSVFTDFPNSAIF